MKYGIFLVFALGLVYAPAAKADLPELVIQEAEKSGCPEHFVSDESHFKEVAPGRWRGTVTGRYYLTPTNIKVKKGQRVKVTASGTICYAALPPNLSEKREMCETEGGKDSVKNLCVGPRGRNYIALGMMTVIMPENGRGEGFPAGHPFLVSKDSEIFFVIKDGNNGWGQTYCQSYGDNCGSFSVEVTVTGT